MIAGIHQPDFLSYFGYFKKIVLSEKFVFLDNVKINSDGWTHRDQIKTKNGTKWITIGKKKNKSTLIKDIQISYDNDWQKKSINLIKENYSKAKYFDEIYDLIEKILLFRTKYLLDFNINSISQVLKILDIKISFLFSSDLNVGGSKNELLINILKKIDCNEYLAGVGSKNYIDEKLFKMKNIKIIWNEFEHPIYKQQYEGFVKNLSIIDLLFNCGSKNLINLLKQK